MVLVLLVSTVGFILFLYGMWDSRQSEGAYLLALALFAITAGLFAWAIKATRAAALHVAFDSSPPSSFTTAGPYRYVRHPFYGAYIVFWLGCAVATQYALSVAFFLVISAIYTVAAFREERAFERTTHAADYAAYRQRAGLFWPRISTRSQH